MFLKTQFGRYPENGFSVACAYLFGWAFIWFTMIPIGLLYLLIRGIQKLWQQRRKKVEKKNWIHYFNSYFPYPSWNRVLLCACLVLVRLWVVAVRIWNLRHGIHCHIVTDLSGIYFGLIDQIGAVFSMEISSFYMVFTIGSVRNCILCHCKIPYNGNLLHCCHARIADSGFFRNQKNCPENLQSAS